MNANGLPAGSAVAQIAQNVVAAQAQYTQFLSQETQLVGMDPLSGTSPALLADRDMLIWIFNQFKPGGSWDYKHQFNRKSDPSDYNAAMAFGNFNFGAVMEGLGLNYYETQNAAGIGQIYICRQGGACGTG